MANFRPQEIQGPIVRRQKPVKMRDSQRARGSGGKPPFLLAACRRRRGWLSLRSVAEECSKRVSLAMNTAAAVKGEPILSDELLRRLVSRLEQLKNISSDPAKVEESIAHVKLTLRLRS